MVLYSKKSYSSHNETLLTDRLGGQNLRVSVNLWYTPSDSALDSGNAALRYMCC